MLARVDADRVQHPPRGRRRGDPAEQAGLVPQHRQIRDRLPDISDHHRHIGQHRPGRCADRRTRPADATLSNASASPVASATSASNRDPT
jgi:hypothetical protein